MAISIYIPTPYRQYTGGSSEVEVEGSTVREVLEKLAAAHPGIGERLFGDDGHIAGHLNVYVNEEEIRSLQGEETPVKDGDEMALVPAMAGGAGGNGVLSSPAPLLDPEQMERYSRHLLLEEVGPAGQKRLLESKVAIIGAGGLGSPVALYLAAAGVGTLGIVDGDRVDRSNLQRQILHTDRDIGRHKTQSARRHLEDLNPDIEVIEHRTFLTSTDALDVLRPYDLVVNGSDNFPTRYLVNDACVLLGKPLVDASILKWEGQLAVFQPGRGCYRCLFPAPPPPGSVPSCAEGGIFGAVAGVMGTLQASEALKLLLGAGEPVSNRMLLFDALSGRFRNLRWQRNPDCPVCGDAPTIRELIDYDAFCGLPSTAGSAAAADATASASPAAAGRAAGAGTAPTGPDLTVTEAAPFLGDGETLWIDVREPGEYERFHIPGSILIRLDDLPDRMSELPADKKSILVCDNGQRSGLAVEILRGSGCPLAFNLAGGLIAWRNHQLPLEAGPARA